MKIIDTSSTKKRRILIISISVFVALITLVFIYIAYGKTADTKVENQDSNTSSATSTTAPTQEQEIDDGTNTKEDTANNESSSPSNTPRGDLTVTIPAKSQNGNIVQIRASIDTVSNTGSCTLTMNRLGVVVTRTANLQALPTTSTCQGFDVATSDLSPGEWQIAIDVVMSDQKGRATSSVVVE